MCALLPSTSRCVVILLMLIGVIAAIVGLPVFAACWSASWHCQQLQQRITALEEAVSSHASAALDSGAARDKVQRCDLCPACRNCPKPPCSIRQDSLTLSLRSFERIMWTYGFESV